MYYFACDLKIKLYHIKRKYSDIDEWDTQKEKQD